VIGDTQIYSGIIASIVAAAVSTVGLLSMAALGDWSRRNSTYFSAFAIGVLLIAVFFHLIPQALSFDTSAWVAVLAGLGGMAFVGGALRLVGSRNTGRAGEAFGFASIIALGFHSFLDGIIYETTFHTHLFTGWLSTIGLLLHEFPEGVIAYFLLREANVGEISSVFWAFVAASLTTIAGAVTTAFVIGNIGAIPFGSLLGASAGGLIYVMVFHLGPHARATPNRRGYMVASGGVVIALAAMILRHF